MKYIFLVLIILTLAAMPVTADSGQYGQYGGTTPVQKILVDKKIGKGTITKGGVIEYVDNLNAQDQRFAPGQKITFQIKVANVSGSELKQIVVTDIMPDYIDAIEGPGSYDPKTKTITWTYASLKTGEEKTEKITAMIKPQSQLPADKGVICLVNNAVVKMTNEQNEDSTQFCIEKQVELTKGGVPIKAPDAGPELGILLGVLQFAGIGAGIYLKKKSTITNRTIAKN